MGNHFGKILPRGECTFLKAGGGILQGGEPEFFSIYQIICPLSCFNTLFYQAKSVCKSVFSKQYNSLVRKTHPLRKFHQSREKALEGGTQIFNT